MSEKSDDDPTYRAFVLGCEVAAHVLGSQAGYFFRSLEFLQALADGDETLLESPSDAAAWFQQLEMDREQIITELGAQGFENMSLHVRREMASTFAIERGKEIALAKGILHSLHGSEPPVL